jgi:hypothetical protein
MSNTQNSRFNRRRLLTGLSALAGLLTTAGQAVAQRKGSGPMDNKKRGNRAEPLFLSEADAREVMRDHCMRGVDHPMSSKQMDLLVSRLRPQFWLAPRKDGGGGPGETRVGGTPDLPKGAAWPMRAIPANAREMAASFEKFAAQHWMAAHALRELPFEFIAQIELAEAARQGEGINGLPDTGRLIFFWDGVLGLHHGGAPACKVFWDETPAGGLETVAIPPVFAELDAAYAVAQHDAAKGTTQDMLKALPDTARMMRSAGVPESDIERALEAIRENAAREPVFDPSLKKPFVYPARAMRLIPLLVLPKQNALELTQDRELTAFADGEDTRAHYWLLTSNDIGPFTTDRSNMRRSQEWLTSEARRSRFLGAPQPEQDDPRFDAVGSADLPPYPWNDAKRAEAIRTASDWQLLLQVSMADLAQITTEGTLYFMVHKADLAKRDFSRVVASYQQT